MTMTFLSVRFGRLVTKEKTLPTHNNPERCGTIELILLLGGGINLILLPLIAVCIGWVLVRIGRALMNVLSALVHLDRTTKRLYEWLQGEWSRKAERALWWSVIIVAPPLAYLMASVSCLVLGECTFASAHLAAAAFHFFGV